MIILLLLAAAFLLNAATLMFKVVDVRKKLPKHPTKRFGQRKKSAIKGIKLHHTAGAVSDTPWDVADYHVGPNHISSTGTPGINYTVVIDRSAKIFWCNDLEAITWHVEGQNTDNASICVIGNYEEYEPTTAQVRAVRLAKRWIEWKVGRSLPMEGHGEACDQCTKCPGKYLLQAIG